LQQPSESPGVFEQARHWLKKEWRALVIPLELERRFWDEQAIGFAKSATDLLGVLNGGALVAIPSFVALSGSELGNVVWPGLSFVAGNRA